MVDSRDATLETAGLPENLLPVELTVRDHYGRETRCVLHKLPAIVGRAEDADVPLLDPWISHRHCQIDQIGNVLVVRDLGSKNGIFLHGHRVREWHVFSGERLTVGRTEITVRYRKAENASATRAGEPGRPAVAGTSSDGKTANRALETQELLY